MTYKEFGATVDLISKAFLKLGLPKRSCCAILSYNRAEWNLAFWASMITDLVAFGIYITNSPEECLHVLNDSRSPIVFVEN